MGDKFDDKAIEKLMSSVDQHLGRNALKNMKKFAHMTHQTNVTSGRVETNRSMRLRTIRAAQEMKSRGIGLNDVVMICGVNHDDISVPIIGCLYLGAPVMALSNDMMYGEVKHFVEMGKPKMLFCDPCVSALFHQVLDDVGLKIEIVVFGETTNERFTPFSDFQKKTGTEEDFEATDFDPATTTSFIVFSSGTTSLPKGICLTHRNFSSQLYLTANNKKNLDYEGGVDQVTVLIYSTTFWFSGVLALLMAAIMGYIRLYTPNAFTPEITFEAIKEYKPRVILLTPTAVISLINHTGMENCDLSSVFAFMCAGAALAPEKLEELQKRVPKGSVMNMYGMTETCGSICFTPKYKRNSCGLMGPWLKSRITDPNTFKEMPTNEVGELWVKSDYTLFKGYYNNPEETAAAFGGDGWFRTGDLMKVDEDGFFFIVDRLKEIFKWRNHHIAPAELEKEIAKVPGVEQCCVVGLPHPEEGDLALAVVEKQPGAIVTAQQVKDIVAANLSANKQLRGGVIFVEKLPLTHSGKIDRKEVNKLKHNHVPE